MSDHRGLLCCAIGVLCSRRLRGAGNLGEACRLAAQAAEVEELGAVSYTHLDVYKRQIRA